MRAVLLDGMGTLVRLEDPVAPLRAALRARCGIEVGADEARAALRAEIAYYRAHHLDGRDPASLAELRGRCARVLAEALPAPAADVPLDAMTAALLSALRFAVYPDAPPMLRRLRAAGLRLVVVSNWDSGLHDVLRETGLATQLDGIVTSAEVGAAKPDPAVFVRGLALAGVPAEAALHCGDVADEDVRGARAAGVRPLLLVREGAPPTGVETISSLTQLAARLG